MFGLNLPEILIILAIALVVIGPDKLPDLARAIGRGIGEFKKATNDLKSTFQADDDLRNIRDTLTQAKHDVANVVREQTQGLQVSDLAKSLTDGTFFQTSEQAASTPIPAPVAPPAVFLEESRQSIGTPTDMATPEVAATLVPESGSMPLQVTAPNEVAADPPVQETQEARPNAPTSAPATPVSTAGAGTVPATDQAPTTPPETYCPDI